MAPQREPHLLLGAVLGAFVWAGCCGSSSHSLYIFYTLFMDSSQDGAQYFVVVHVDDQLVARFDPTTRRMLPQVAWLHNVKEEDSYFWNMTSHIVNSMEPKFRNDLHVLHIYNNSSRAGFHSWQNVIGCKLSDEGQKQGIYQYGYDGEDFISLDQKTLSWITGNVHAQKIKRWWENMTLIAHRRNHCLENKCIKLLQKCVMYGKDSLLRKEPPVAEVTYKNLATLVCTVYGFYPKEVNVTWRKDGEVWKKNISWAGVLPNSDGTYYTWLSIEVDLEEKRDRYHCYVEHAGLPEPLIVTWVEPASNLGLLATVMMPVVAVALIGVVIFYVAKCVGDTGRNISTTSQEFQMQPVLRDQDQRQQDQDQMQQRMMMEDFQRMRMQAGPLGPFWNSC